MKVVGVVFENDDKIYYLDASKFDLKKKVQFSKQKKKKIKKKKKQKKKKKTEHYLNQLKKK